MAITGQFGFFIMAFSPRLYCLEPFPSNGGGDCHGPRWPAARRPVTNKPHTRGCQAGRVQAGLWYWSRLSYAQTMLPILRILPVGGVLLAIFILVLALSPPDGPRAPLNTTMAPARGALVDAGHHPETRQFLIRAAIKRADELNRLRELHDTPTRPAPAEPAALESAPSAPAADEQKIAGLPGDRIETDPEVEQPAATETPYVSIPVERGEVSAPELPVSPKD